MEQFAKACVETEAILKEEGGCFFCIMEQRFGYRIINLKEAVNAQSPQNSSKETLRRFI